MNYLASADIDHDGDVDLFASAADGDKIGYWENQGDGTFELHSVTGDFASASITLVDVDNDQDLDILAVSHHPGIFAWFENMS